MILRTLGNVLVACIALVFFAAAVGASEGTITLLAVAETPEGVLGSPAELHLEIRPGSGRVFIESFPAAKLDTQISTRFANQIACKYVGNHCHRYDFFYTIKAKSSIIGGPSAGAAVAVLTVAVLQELPLNQSLAMTGTINSGELIGPVGYLHAKLDAAADAGVRAVLVPFTRERLGDTNVTINLTAYGGELGIAVRQVQTLDEALHAFTGKRMRNAPRNVTIDTRYAATMTRVAEQLCDRSVTLQQRANATRTPDEESERREAADNSTALGLVLLVQGRSYSAASNCFGANVKYTALALRASSTARLEQRRNSVAKDLAEMEQYTAAVPLRTITDLEVSMAVGDRLAEARDALNDSVVLVAENDTEGALDSLAYAIERIDSAAAWSQFFGTSGKRFRFSQERLASSCAAKLAEAQEHLNYLALFFPAPGVQDRVDRALAMYQTGNHVRCLGEAALAKAEASSVLGALGLDTADVGMYIDAKLGAAEHIIAENQRAGMFPVLGYSYYTYAQDLRESNPGAALLYAEYALELANLDMYFPQEPLLELSLSAAEWRELLLFLAGLLLGLLLARRMRKGMMRRKVRQMRRTVRPLWKR